MVETWAQKGRGELELEGFRIGVDCNRSVRAGVSHIAIKLNRSGDFHLAPHRNAEHRAAGANIHRRTCLSNDFSGMQGGCAAKERNPSFRGFDHRRDEVFLFLPGERCALAKRTVAQNAVHTCVNQCVDDSRGLIEIHGVFRPPIRRVGRRGRWHDDPGAMNVVGRQARFCFLHHFLLSIEFGIS
jgi:hypothetical protein